jgi:hypothetical protein
MTLTHPDRERPREQHNHGSGPFIGGDNYGRIEMLDATTKAMLAKLTQTAPALARLVERALRDGVMSPDVVHALQRAASAINEDVAAAMLSASRNINEEVATVLAMAAGTITTDADRLADIERCLADRATDLAGIADAFGSHQRPGFVDRLDEILARLTDEASRIEYAYAPPAPVRVLDWQKIKIVFAAGFALGAMIVYLVMR